jgi:hypothetical protein
MTSPQLTNGEPGAVLSVTQNWNPGSGGGVYNDYPVGAVYDAKMKRWTVYNREAVVAAIVGHWTPSPVKRFEAFSATKVTLHWGRIKEFVRLHSIFAERGYTNSCLRSRAQGGWVVHGCKGGPTCTT